MSRRRAPLALLGLIGSLLLAAPARAEVMLHAFGWRYRLVEQRAAAIAAAGYKAVLVAPPHKSDRSGGCPWWRLYQPQDWRVIDNCAGDGVAFKAMVAALRRHDVRTVEDVVLNHMANERDGATAFPGPVALRAYAAEPRLWAARRLYGDLRVGQFSPQDFHPPFCIQGDDDPEAVRRGRLCGGAGDRGLPDLRASEAVGDWVSGQRRQLIEALYGLGVRGFRLDAAKHMPVAEIRAAVPEPIARNAHVFAELISWGGAGEASYGRFLEPYLRQLPASFGAYDFPLFHTLRHALRPAGSLTALVDPTGQGQALEARRAVTVVVTHDIPANAGFQFLILDPIDEQLAYAYLLGRDGGTPLVFDDGSAERFERGRWVGAWQQGWLRRWIVFHNRMHGLPMAVLHADRCSLVWRRGPAADGAVMGVAAINKCAEVQELSVPSPRGRWRWQLLERNAQTPGLRIEADQLRLRLGPRRALLWMGEGPGQP
jgi:alpha-amylase